MVKQQYDIWHLVNSWTMTNFSYSLFYNFEINIITSIFLINTVFIFLVYFYSFHLFNVPDISQTFKFVKNSNNLNWA